MNSRIKIISLFLGTTLLLAGCDSSNSSEVKPNSDDTNNITNNVDDGRPNDDNPSDNKPPVEEEPTETHNLSSTYTMIDEEYHGRMCFTHNVYENIEEHELVPYNDPMNPEYGNLVSLNYETQFSLQIRSEHLRCEKCEFHKDVTASRSDVTEQKDTLIPLIKNALTNYSHSYKTVGKYGYYSSVYFIDDPQIDSSFLFDENGWIDSLLEKYYRFCYFALSNAEVTHISKIGDFYYLETSSFLNSTRINEYGDISQMRAVFDKEYRLIRYGLDYTNGRHEGSEELYYFTPDEAALSNVKQIVLSKKAEFNKNDFTIEKIYEEASSDENRYIIMYKNHVEYEYTEDKITGNFKNCGDYGKYERDIANYTDTSQEHDEPDGSYESYMNYFGQILQKNKTDYFNENIPIVDIINSIIGNIPDNYVVGYYGLFHGEVVTFHLPDGRVVGISKMGVNEPDSHRYMYFSIDIDPDLYVGNNDTIEMYTRDDSFPYNLVGDSVFSYQGYKLVDGALYTVKDGIATFNNYYSEHDDSSRPDRTLTILDEVEINGIKYTVEEVDVAQIENDNNKIDYIVLGKNITKIKHLRGNFKETLITPKENSLKTVKDVECFKSVQIPINGISFQEEIHSSKEMYIFNTNYLLDEIEKDVYLIGNGTLSFIGANKLKDVKKVFIADSVTIEEKTVNGNRVTALSYLKKVEHIGVGIRNTRNLGELFSEESATGLTEVHQTRWQGITTKEASPRTYYVPSTLSKITLFSGCTINNFAFTGTIPSGYFDNCSFISAIDFEIGAFGEGKTLYREVFDGTSITELNIPSAFAYIYANAIHELSTLQSITFNGGVDVLIHSIVSCSNLTSISFKGDFAMVRREFFQYCPSISEVNFELNPNKDYFGRTAHVDGSNNDLIHNYDFEDSDIEISVDLSDPSANALKLKPSGELRNYFLYSRDKA